MSVYVTDTHSLIWYSSGHRNKLSRRALRAFQSAERNEAYIYIPAVTLWEISRLELEGAIRLNTPFTDWADALLAHSSFECVPLDEWIIAEARGYRFNRDVFDAAIVATARLKDVPLITKDQAITNSRVVDIWW
jgi:PIN domain nuclease of toxin-antitoxin system